MSKPQTKRFPSDSGINCHDVTGVRKEKGSEGWESGSSRLRVINVSYVSRWIVESQYSVARFRSVNIFITKSSPPTEHRSRFLALPSDRRSRRWEFLDSTLTTAIFIHGTSPVYAIGYLQSGKLLYSCRFLPNFPGNLDETERWIRYGKRGGLRISKEKSL